MYLILYSADEKLETTISLSSGFRNHEAMDDDDNSN